MVLIRSEEPAQRARPPPRPSALGADAFSRILIGF
jgi:hypothetical protein